MCTYIVYKTRCNRADVTYLLRHCTFVCLYCININMMGFFLALIVHYNFNYIIQWPGEIKF